IGREIDRYIRGGRGNARALVRRMSPQYRFGEVADVLRWLRRYNAGRADEVRFVGVEHDATSRLAYDAVERYVARTVPGLLPELRRARRPIRPWADIWNYAGWYAQQKDKSPYVRHARAVYRLVAGLPRPRHHRRYDLALHDAHQIRSFHVHY